MVMGTHDSYQPTISVFCVSDENSLKIHCTVIPSKIHILNSKHGLVCPNMHRDLLYW